MEMIIMMMCSECHEKIAVVFVNKIENKTNEVKGYCIDCAEKHGIDVEKEIKNKTGMSTEEFNNMNKQMENMFEDMDMDSFKEQMETMMPGMMNLDGEGDDSSPIMNAFNSLFKGNETSESSNKNKKTGKSKG